MHVVTRRSLLALLPFPAFVTASSDNVAFVSSWQKGSNVIDLTWRNASDHTFLFAMGSLYGEIAIPSLTFQLLTQDGKQINLLYASELGVVAGRVDPWIITLPSKSEYTLHIFLKNLVLTKTAQPVQELSRTGWKLVISYQGLQGFDRAPGGKKVPYSITQNGPTTIPFWKGTLRTAITNNQ